MFNHFFFFGISIFQLFLHLKIGKQSRKYGRNKKMLCDIKSNAEKERCQKMTFEWNHYNDFSLNAEKERETKSGLLI